MFNKRTSIKPAVLMIILTSTVLAQAGETLSVSPSFGTTFINTNATFYGGEIEYKDFELNYINVEPDDTRFDVVKQERMEVYSVSHKWYNGQGYLRFGGSYNTGTPLMGDTNFVIGAGLEFENNWQIDFVHHSSAQIHSPNQPLDYIKISYSFQMM